MDKLQQNNMKYHLARRIELLEEIVSRLQEAGIFFRQVINLDDKLTESFRHEYIFPAGFDPSEVREAVNNEFEFQLTTGDPARDSFRAAVEPPRADIAEQMKTIHESLLRDISEGKGA